MAYTVGWSCGYYDCQGGRRRRGGRGGGIVVVSLLLFLLLLSAVVVVVVVVGEVEEGFEGIVLLDVWIITLFFFERASVEMGRKIWYGMVWYLMVLGWDGFWVVRGTRRVVGGKGKESLDDGRG